MICSSTFVGKSRTVTTTENLRSESKEDDYPSYYNFKTAKENSFFFSYDTRAVFNTFVVITWVMHKNMQ